MRLFGFNKIGQYFVKYSIFNILNETKRMALHRLWGQLSHTFYEQRFKICQKYCSELKNIKSAMLLIFK